MFHLHLYIFVPKIFVFLTKVFYVYGHHSSDMSRRKKTENHGVRYHDFHDLPSTHSLCIHHTSQPVSMTSESKMTNLVCILTL